MYGRGEEVLGVHRHKSYNTSGYITLRMKDTIDVSERLSVSGPKRENDVFKTSIRGLNTKRILSG